MTKDTNKTKEQLISELDLLRRRVAELEESGVGQRQTEERLVVSRLQYDTTLESMVDAIHVVLMRCYLPQIPHVRKGSDAWRT